MKRIWITFLFSMPGIYIIAQSNVGIGMNNPVFARLQVNGVFGTGTTSALFGGDGAGVSFQRNLPVIGFNQYRDNVSGEGRYIFNGYAATQTFDHTTGYMYFDMYPGGTANSFTGLGNRSITITNLGTVGIRTSPNAATLSIARAGNIDGAAVFGGTIYSSQFLEGVNESTHIRGGKTSSRVLINDVNSGSVIMGGGSALVGINTAFPVATLDIHQVSGKGYIIIDPDESFQTYEFHVGYYDSPPTSDLKVYKDEIFTGYYWAVTGEFAWAGSDNRIKNNIQPVGSVLKKLQMLRPREYEMKEFNDSHERTFGFIAQEVDKLFPEFVEVQHIPVDSVNRIPDLHSLNYSGFDIIAIKALQEQYDQLKILEKKNSALVRRLEELEKKLIDSK